MRKLALIISTALLFAACGKDRTETKTIQFFTAGDWVQQTKDLSSNGTSTISSVAINNVPIQRNRSTEYSGNLFTNGGTTSLSLNDTWGDPFTGTW